MSETYALSVFKEAGQATAPLRNNSVGASLYMKMDPSEFKPKQDHIDYDSCLRSKQVISPAKKPRSYEISPLR
jgi:hypothetical protein